MSLQWNSGTIRALTQADFGMRKMIFALRPPARGDTQIRVPSDRSAVHEELSLRYGIYIETTLKSLRKRRRQAQSNEGISRISGRSPYDPFCTARETKLRDRKFFGGGK